MSKQNKLNNLESHKLFALVQETYVTSGQTDVEFALHASQRLGFTVNESNVAGLRRALNIASNFKTQAAAKKAAEPKKWTLTELAEAYCALDDRMKALEARAPAHAVHPAFGGAVLLADAGRAVSHNGVGS